MNEQIELETNCIFAVFAVENARVEIPPAFVLQDGTRVYSTSPFSLEAFWQEWLGSVRFNKVQNCNLFLVRTILPIAINPDGSPVFLAGGEKKLQQDLTGIFTMLRIVGAIEYDDQFVIGGRMVQGNPSVQHIGVGYPFKHTKGTLPWKVKQPHLETAAQLYESHCKLAEKHPQNYGWRFGRGCQRLKRGLEEYYGGDRLHAFVQAVDAVIFPRKRSTTRDFRHRCSLFAGPKSAQNNLQTLLAEVYEMRCDIEHVHDWDRSLQKYPANKRENIALWRVKQMEELATSLYRRILLQPALHAGLCGDDLALESFWKQPSDDIRRAFGDFCDITAVPFIEHFDAWDRAAFQDWPSGWAENHA
jgi:hypothetical protein